MSLVSYPSDFLTRPVDRDFLQRMHEAGCSRELAESVLYRMWRDFASGGSDRRQLQGSGDNLGSERAVKLFEEHCLNGHQPTLSETPGLLVTLAVDAGFLAVETSGERACLICTGFYPINSAFSAGGKSFQRKGAFSKWLKRDLQEAEVLAGGQVELWQRNGAFGGFTPEQRGQAAVFIHSLCKCAQVPVPSDSELRGGMFSSAIQCLENTTPEHRKLALLHLISTRKEASTPPTLRGILEAWPNLVKKALNEVG